MWRFSNHNLTLWNQILRKMNGPNSAGLKMCATSLQLHPSWINSITQFIMHTVPSPYVSADIIKLEWMNKWACWDSCCHSPAQTMWVTHVCTWVHYCWKYLGRSMRVYQCTFSIRRNRPTVLKSAIFSQNTIVEI